MASRSQSLNLEPRVTRVETEIGALTRDVGQLTQDVRALTVAVSKRDEMFEGELKKVLVAVTQAAAPRRTDWGTVLSALAVGLAIGAAVLSPIYHRLSSAEETLAANHEQISRHELLDSHPVSKAKLENLTTCVEHAVADRIRVTDRLDERLTDVEKRVGLKANGTPP